MGRPSVRRSPTCRRKFKLERIPDYLRETVDWIIGYVLLSRWVFRFDSCLIRRRLDQLSVRVRSFFSWDAIFAIAGRRTSQQLGAIFGGVYIRHSSSSSSSRPSYQSTVLCRGKNGQSLAALVFVPCTHAHAAPTDTQTNCKTRTASCECFRVIEVGPRVENMIHDGRARVILSLSEIRSAKVVHRSGLVNHKLLSILLVV